MGCIRRPKQACPKPVDRILKRHVTALTHDERSWEHDERSWEHDERSWDYDVCLHLLVTSVLQMLKVLGCKTIFWTARPSTSLMPSADRRWVRLGLWLAVTAVRASSSGAKITEYQL
jgi:hypothetical protein